MKMLRLWFWSLSVGVWLAGLAPLLGAAPTPQATNASDLWGSEGERWTPRSRLPDFSFAGYHAGEKPIPDVAVKSSIKDFGAQGDGVADDTAAFQRALASVNKGAIVIPAGRYRITGALTIQKPGLVLRGAGEGQTTLYFDKSLEALLGVGKVPYWGGLLDVHGEINVVGLDKWRSEKTEADAWIESWPGETTVPPNLYEAQRSQRLSKTATTPK